MVRANSPPQTRSFRSSNLQLPNLRKDSTHVKRTPSESLHHVFRKTRRFGNPASDEWRIASCPNNRGAGEQKGLPGKPKVAPKLQPIVPMSPRRVCQALACVENFKWSRK